VPQLIVPSALPSPRAAVRTLLTGYRDGVAPWVRAMEQPGDDGWFGPGSTIWAVHADAATLVGGIRALLVQAMHPTVLAGFDQHSDYREDPETRLQRTATFVTVTTFGTTRQARAACERVRRAHSVVRGCTATGEPYDAGDPELLGWVHLALADSLAVAVERFGRTGFDLDAYLADMAVVGEQLDAAHVPHDTTELAAAWRHYRPQLAVTGDTAAAHAFLLDPPLPARIRHPYRVLASAAAASLPPDLRPLLAARAALPAVPSRLVGRAVTQLLALVLGESPAAAAAHRRTSSPLSPG
jgi:uncharacterized protein (DUF2236 family)